MVGNKRLIFNSIPSGMPEVGVNLGIKDETLDLSNVPVGGIITKNLFVSYDPYQRICMREPQGLTYFRPYQVGQPIYNYGVAQVVATDNSAYLEGDIIGGFVGTEEYTPLTEPEVRKVRKISNPFGFPLSLFLGALGLPGLAAYSSLYEIGKPKVGETIYISAASGAVGSLVAQLCKAEGLRVVGSAGTDAKVAFLKNDLGLDAAFNYKKEPALQAIPKYAPEGLDIYYDNVGGETLDAVLLHAKNFLRIICCGAISQYNKAPDGGYQHRNIGVIVTKRVRVQGFIVTDPEMGPKYEAEHQRVITKKLCNGQLIVPETITHGIDKAADGLIGLLKGENVGKALLKIADPLATNHD